RGSDVMEGEAPSPIAITVHHDHRQTTINATNVGQVGDHNQQSITVTLEQVRQAFERADAPKEEKRVWAQRMLKALRHPLTVKVLGSAGEQSVLAFAAWLEGEA